MSRSSDDFAAFTTMSREWAGRTVASWPHTVREGSPEAQVRGWMRSAVPALVRGAVRATGLNSPASSLRIDRVNRAAWAVHTADDYATIAWRVAELLGGSAGQAPSAEETRLEALADRFGGWAGFVGMAVGRLIGGLASAAIGQFDVPLPRADMGVVRLIPENVVVFADRLDEPLENAFRWAVWQDAVRWTIVAQPHVGERITTLVPRYVGLGNYDLSAVAGIVTASSEGGGLDRDAVLAALTTDAQARMGSELQALNAVMAATAWYLAKTHPEAGIAVAPRLEAALERRRADSPIQEWLLEWLLGLRFDLAQYRQAQGFVAAVGAADRLPGLWQSPASLPTPEDLAEPDLWFRRTLPLA